MESEMKVVRFMESKMENDAVLKTGVVRFHDTTVLIAGQGYDCLVLRERDARELATAIDDYLKLVESAESQQPGAAGEE